MRRMSKNGRASQQASPISLFPQPSQSPTEGNLGENLETDEGIEFEDEIEGEGEEQEGEGFYEDLDNPYSNSSGDKLPVEAEGLAKDNSNEQPEYRMDKPQIWVRIKSKSMDCMYEIDDDQKTLKFMVVPEDKLFQRTYGDTACFSFETEGIFNGPGVPQDDVYETVVAPIVESALQGTSGVVVCIGPEQSGKSFTLFGRSNGSFRDRGLLPRALEDIFARLQYNSKTEFHIILSMFEVRKDRMKDLITLDSQDLTRVGNFGPKGLFFEEVLSIDHALELVLRGLEGQRLMPCEVHPPHAKYHTLVYIDILAHERQESWRSRITFAKIASIPPDVKNCPPSANQTTNIFSPCGQYTGRKDKCYGTDGNPRKCCGGPHGALAELINVRKDMYFLEQMFTKCYDAQKFNEYCSELEKLGMNALTRSSNKNPSSYFRQSKLAYCLKDIVSETAFVRLILHVRPQRDYLHSTLENMRFAERVRCLAGGLATIYDGAASAASEMKICDEAGVNTNPMGNHLHDKIHQDKLKDAFKMATTLFEDKLETLEETCKEQIKPAFDDFKQMWEGMLDQEFAEIPPSEEEDGEEHEEEGDASEGPSEIDSQSQTSETGKGGKKVNTGEEDPLNPDGNKEANKNKSLSKRSLRQSSSGRKKSRRSKKSMKAPVSGEEESSAPTTATLLSGDTSSKNSTSGPNTEMSITVIPTGTAEPMEGNIDHPVTNLHFKCKCWETFAQTEAGNPLVAELGEKENLLRKYMADHSETLQEVVTALSKLVALELNMDQIEPNGKFNDETSEMNLLTTKEQRMETAAQAKQELKKLQEQQAHIRTLSNAVHSTKLECDKAFDEFCEESNGASRGESRHHRPPVDGELELRYGDINRIAKEEAQILIQRAYPKRPPWSMLF